MLTFKPNVRIGYFDERAGLVLQLASVWSLRAGIDVEVSAANAPTDQNLTAYRYDLAWDLDTAGDNEANIFDLARFLDCRLPAPYAVYKQRGRVHVEFDARSKV